MPPQKHASFFSDKGLENYSDQVLSAQKLDGLDFANDIFRNVGFKGATIRKCRFNKCIFEDTYFRDAIFEECDFTGARFRGCNFYGATFSACRFDYARFYETEIKASQITKSLPSFANVRAALLRNLRANAEAIGRAVDVPIYFDRELAATREHLKAASLGADLYYSKKYKGTDRLVMRVRLLQHDISGFWWGHGESVVKLARTTSLLLMTFSIATLAWGSDKIRGGSFTQRPWIVVWRSVEFVASSFLGNTFGDTQFDSDRDRVLCLLITLSGYLTLALLTSVLYKRLVRR
jgi:hypothetical protein